MGWLLFETGIHRLGRPWVITHGYSTYKIMPSKVNTYRHRSTILTYMDKAGVNLLDLLVLQRREKKICCGFEYFFYISLDEVKMN